MESLQVIPISPPQHRRPVSTPRTLCVALLGPGGIGATLLEQLRQALPTLGNNLHRQPQVQVLCNSTQMLLTPDAIGLTSWRQTLIAHGEPYSLPKINQFLSNQEAPVAVIDATAAKDVAAQHAGWLRRGYAVLTANKLAAAAPLAEYQALRQAEAVFGGRYFCETTVGAGLPVIGVLADFVRTGDEILQVDGILSGTLSHLLTRVEQGTPFSQAVRSLHAGGFTEPDPRSDLAGLDVARKLLILARIAGIPLELADLAVEPCIDLEGSREPVTEFLAGCERFDAAVAALSAAARARDAALRYTASVQKDGTARVGLTAVPLSHPFARLRPGDNLVQITTARYRDNPLVIQGPGAGRAVTAAGLLADLLRCARDGM